MKADTARLEITLDTTLWQMPEGAGYTASSGRAHVKASVKHGTDGKPPTLVIESGCDSLERLCLMYEAENERLSVANRQLRNSVETLNEERLKTLLARSAWYMIIVAGLTVGGVLTLLTRKKT